MAESLSGNASDKSESVSESILRELRSISQILRTLSKDFRLTGDLLQHPIRFIPPAAPLLQFIRRVYNQFGIKGTWENVDAWIESISKLVSRALNYSSEYGIDPDSTSEHLKDSLQRLEVLKDSANRRYYGPNWKSCEELYCRIHGYELRPTHAIPLAKIEPHIFPVASKVMEDWHVLRQYAEQRKLVHFRAQWARLDKTQRHLWLERWSDILLEKPDAHIYAMTPSEGTEERPNKKQLLQPPLLNLEDISTGDNLPNMLDSRVTGHPRSFLSTDGRAVPLALFCGSLPTLSCEGRVLFSDMTEQSYGIQLVEDTGRLGLPSPSLVVYQLKAQSMIMKFLRESQGSLLPPVGIDRKPPRSTSPEVATLSASIFRRMVQLDYAPAGRVDLQFVRELLHGCLEEALDNLFLMRTDPKFWVAQAKRYPYENRTEVMLTTLFGRIDRFRCLEGIVDHLFPEAQPIELLQHATYENLKDWIELEVALQLVLNEIVSNFRDAGHQENDMLTALLRLISAKKPIVWIAGLPDFLRTIDRELMGRQSRLSVYALQTLHDSSIVAICLREIQKFHTVASENGIRQYCDFTVEYESKWNEKYRDWTSLAIQTCNSIPLEEKRKLDSVVSRDLLQASSRRSQFWVTIDHYMERNSREGPAKPLFDLICEMAPVNCDKRCPIDKYPSGLLHARPIQPTQTQVRTSKGHSSLLESVSPVTSKCTEPVPPQREVIRITTQSRSRGFWVNLLEGQSELYWIDFCNAMCEIGCSLSGFGGGSYCIFTSKGRGRNHRIVFHRPHAPKLPAKLARRWWWYRLNRIFDVVIEQ